MAWHNSKEENDRAVAEAKAVILAAVPAWKARGVTEVKCLYDGTGDEGSISGFEFDGESVGDSYFPNEVYNAFEELTFANVSYDNEGGGGEIKVDLAKDPPVISRDEYYYETSREPVGDTEVL